MPEARLARARRSLPNDYQFGDAGRRASLYISDEILGDARIVLPAQPPRLSWLSWLCAGETPLCDPHPADAHMDADGYGAGV